MLWDFSPYSLARVSNALSAHTNRIFIFAPQYNTHAMIYMDHIWFCIRANSFSKIFLKKKKIESVEAFRIQKTEKQKYLFYIFLLTTNAHHLLRGTFNFCIKEFKTVNFNYGYVCVQFFICFFVFVLSSGQAYTYPVWYISDSFTPDIFVSASVCDCLCLCANLKTLRDMGLALRGLV